MFQNTKLLIAFSITIVGLGVYLLWFGLRPNTQIYQPTPAPTTAQGSKEDTPSAVSDIEGDQALVTKVIDGDTIRVNINNKEHTVRLLGVDTPETVDPRKSVQCFGKEASRETKILLEGQEVVLQKDVSEVDKYGRLLRYIFLPLEEGKLLFVDDYLIREGFAKVLTIPPDIKYSEQFLEAQKEAREARRGLWGRC